jgi:glycosyltransferase involved in cell wall biosynthesis
MFPSEFSKKILERQFSDMQCEVLRHWAPAKIFPPPSQNVPYRFYTIGNVNDPRKNINMLIDVFLECKHDGLFAPKTQLIIKATCNRDFALKQKYPDILVMNGLLDERSLEMIHTSSSCYVNCSHSEGVGMGAVEAALHGRPVITTDYGGLNEYVKTPYVVPCKIGPIGFDDFMFTKDMHWGHPDREALKRHMIHVNQNDIREFDHSHTLTLMKETEHNLLQL